MKFRNLDLLIVEVGLAEKVFTNISAANAVGSPVEFNTLRIEIVAQPVGEGGAVLENGALGRVPKVLAVEEEHCQAEISLLVGGSFVLVNSLSRSLSPLSSV